MNMGKFFSKEKRHKYGDQFDKPDVVAAHFDSAESTDVMKEQPVSHIHQEPVTCLAIVKPGLCLSGSKDKTVILYDYKNQHVSDRWAGHSKEITKVCYDKTNQVAFSASRDTNICAWKHGKSDAVGTFSGHNLVVSAIDLSKDSKLLCSGSRDNTVRIWDVSTRQEVACKNLAQNLVTDVKWIPDSDLVVQTGEDKEVRVYDSRTLEVAFSFPKKQYIQMACDVTPDGRYCVSCSNGFGGSGCEATLWDLHSRCIVSEFKGHHEAIESCIFVPTVHSDRPPVIATCGRDCELRIWHLATTTQLAHTWFSGSGPLTSLAAYNDGSILVGTFNHGIQVLQLTNDVLNITRVDEF